MGYWKNNFFTFNWSTITSIKFLSINAINVLLSSTLFDANAKYCLSHESPYPMLQISDFTPIAAVAGPTVPSPASYGPVQADSNWRRHIPRICFISQTGWELRPSVIKVNAQTHFICWCSDGIRVKEDEIREFCELETVWN